MKVDIVSESDDNFKIEVKQFGVVHVAKDVGGRVVIADTEEQAVKALEEMQEQNIKAAQGAPIENPKGLDLFNGTSWGKTK